MRVGDVVERIAIERFDVVGRVGEWVCGGKESSA